jgi:hypothetical protein
MLSRFGAYGGVDGTSEALWPVKRARQSAKLAAALAVLEVHARQLGGVRNGLARFIFSGRIRFGRTGLNLDAHLLVSRQRRLEMPLDSGTLRIDAAQSTCSNANGLSPVWKQWQSHPTCSRPS